MGRKPQTLAIHAGQEPDPLTGSVMLPIYVSSTYVDTKSTDGLSYEYGRVDNPNRRALEQCVAALEGASHGLAFSSGVAAMDAVVRLLSPGDHILASSDIYGGTYRLFEEITSVMGVQTSWVDIADPIKIREHARPIPRSYGLKHRAIRPFGSLIEMPSLLSHGSIPRKDRIASGITDSLVRISVGLEAFEDLRDDLEQALIA